MTLETKLFLISLCKTIIDGSLDHDCRRSDPEGYCRWCDKASQAITELNSIDSMSNCCAAPITDNGLCSDCKEHTI